jgi:hypothetical protein
MFPSKSPRVGRSEACVADANSTDREGAGGKGMRGPVNLVRCHRVRDDDGAGHTPLTGIAGAPGMRRANHALSAAKQAVIILGVKQHHGSEAGGLVPPGTCRDAKSL